MTWIGPFEPTVAPPGERPAYWLRREFEVAEPGPATLQFSARGIVEVFLNGSRIGDELLPGYTQYEHRLPVRFYDVSEHVRRGANAIVIVLADGWFRGQTGALRAADQWGDATSVWVASKSTVRPRCPPIRRGAVRSPTSGAPT
jgi:Alpha-L-rhamnosidase N-terminal domain